MQSEIVKISKLKNNTGQVEGLPQNPRVLKDFKYEKLKKSIQEDPEMLSLREVIAYDNDGELIVICGNMRLKALKELGIKEVPTKILASDTPIEKLKAYLIKDNNSFGEWDTDMLANEWDAEQIIDWGVDIPSFENLELEENQVDEDEPQNNNNLKVTFASVEQLQKAKNDIQELIDRKYQGSYIT